MEIDGFVLAGGSSSRLGVPKAHVLIGDVSMLDRAVLALRSVCGSVRVAGDLGGVTGLEFVPDEPIDIDGQRIAASIIGLRTAISSAKTDWVAVLACDLPFVTGGVFERMLHRLTEAGPDRYDVIVIKQADGRFQPLVGIYRTQPSLQAIVDAIPGGELSLHSLLDRLRILALPAAVFGNDTPRIFMNINTAADLDRARLALLSG
jgi:molybdopterin-guanine dinucleotide biosynthesis protein A